MNSNEMRNIRDVYTYSGTFDAELWYIYLYGTVPSRYEHEVKGDEGFDFGTFDVMSLQKFFKEPIQFRRYSYTLIDNREDASDKDEFNIEDIVANESYGGSISVKGDHRVVFIKQGSVVIFYEPTEDYEAIKELAKEIYDTVPQEEPEEQKSKVGLIKVYNGDYYTDACKIREVDINIEETYNDDFLPVYKDVREFLKSDRSGIILFYGEAGSGKTTVIRHLCAVEPKEYIIVPNSVATHLGDPELISFVTDHKGAVFILEDCEQILEDRSENAWNSAISTILNMSDGLTGDIANIKFICTFNAPVTKIDPALLRKGRCVAKYEFKELCEDKVAALNDKYELDLPEIKPMTVAEIFNADKADYTEEKKRKKIGF